MTLTTGQILQNRYRIVSLLGQGGMGSVYRAWDTRLNIPVALKEMTPQPGIDSQTLTQLRQQFQQEATVLARLDHPHLVSVTDFFEEGGNAYLVMNFVQGKSLADRIEREGALPESLVLEWASQLLDALAYCHDQGVLHRDLKPPNVIIRSDDQVALVDFGLVKLWDPHDPHTRTAIRSMGTPEYAPPEQYDTAGHTDPRSDVYGLGATLYHALTGQSPPTATRRIVNPAALSPVRTLNPHVSTRAEAALTQALELQPEARFQSATEMRDALKGTQWFTPPPSPPSPHQHPTGARVIVEPSPAPRRGATPWKWIGIAGGVAILGAVLLGGAIAAALWFGQRPSAPQVVPSATVTVSSDAVAEDVSSATDTPPPPSPTGTHTPAPPSPTPSETAPPTVTPQPTSTPLPTETPTPSCPAVTGPFATHWQAEQDRLGCATDAAHATWMAQQHFEWGQMFWRKDTDGVLAVHDSGIWGEYQNTWHEGDPEHSCPDSAPAESPPTPKRGFGKIWCTYTEVRNGLGWATDGERGFDGTVQNFERGAILRADTGETYVLFDDNTWAQH
ncbi:MAG: serine/threonine-protein kinase [Chloroflexota bacterium]|nr:serine/threonine-protein kinase [Chloroflexota bacterium]